MMKIEQLTDVRPLNVDDSVIIQGDALRALRCLSANSVQCVVTSPPYWGLRDYEIDGQIGLEPTLPQYINHLVAVFNGIKRVLRDDGTVWLNMGDGYTSGNRGYRASDKKNPARAMSIRPDTPEGLKPKDLQGVPWRLAFALQDDGWFLRSEVIWEKPNAQPESVKDRPTRSHEQLFMLTKSEQYYYDYKASQEPGKDGKLRNRRTVWKVHTQPYPDAHFATFPPALIEPCVRISSRLGDIVLDPFFGAGTVGVVCNPLDRRYVGIEINSKFVEMAASRLATSQGRLIQIAA